MAPDRPRRFGRYQLQTRIGRGGMAEVWRAEEALSDGTRRTVALKRLVPLLGDDASFTRLLAREAHLSARLRHPHIVATLASGEVAGRCFIAMELVRGCDLNAL